MYFVVQAISLLRDLGVFGFIVPNTWLLINSGAEFRRKLLSLCVREIIDHGDGVFKKATVESATLVLAKSDNSNGQCRAIRIHKGITTVDHFVDTKIWTVDQFCRIVIELNTQTQRLLEKLQSRSTLFADRCVIIWGIKPYQVGHGIPPQTREMLDKRIYHALTKKGDQWKPLLVGSDINRYECQFPGNRYIKYGKWLMYPSNEALMLQPKIFLRQTSDILRACYDDDGYYCQNSVFIIHSNEINLKFLLGLLNSRLLRFVYKLGNPQAGKVFAEIKPIVIKQLPICQIDLLNTRGRTRHDRMVKLVEQMLTLHKQLAVAQTGHDTTIIQRQIDATDRQIDRLVYELYNLSEEEIGIVEGTAVVSEK